MNFFFPYFIIICFLFMHHLRKSSKITEENTQNFWEKERQANLTRRKDIEHLDYITIPYEKLPFLENPSSNILPYQNDIMNLKDQLIINLNGITNTELKLNYGAANITALSEYDENFLKLNTILGKWAQTLIDEGYTKEALIVLEFAVDAGCDTILIYENILKLYSDLGINKNSYLLSRIESSKSLAKSRIIDLIKSYQ